MDTAYIGVRTLRLTAGEGPERIARVLRAHWCAAPLRLRPYWLVRVSWLQLQLPPPPGDSHQRASGGRLMR